jgi:hypothetical protein
MYRLNVTGHSLGGALATIFGFYASADKRVAVVCCPGSAVHVFAFSNPWVGDMLFFEAFRHQEMSKQIRLVRIANRGDLGEIPEL